MDDSVVVTVVVRASSARRPRVEDSRATPSRRSASSFARAGEGTDSPIVTRQGDPFVRTHESRESRRRDRVGRTHDV